MVRVLIVVGGIVVLVGLALLLVLVAVIAAQTGAGNFNGMGGCGTGATPLCALSPQGDNAVTLRARDMASHLNSSCLGKNPDCLGDAAFDAGFPQAILRFAQQTCPGCLAWQNNHFQCVAFVLGAYGAPYPPPADWAHPLDMAGNANAWWAEYGTAHAQALGYREIPAGGHGLPISPGDIMAWAGGQDGHVSIVLGWTPPSGTQPGSITFAQANGESPFQTLPIKPDYTIDTHDGYWNGFVVQGYIHPLWLPPASSTHGSVSMPAGMPNSPYVQLAWQDAQQAGIRPDYFVRQINQESGFSPTALSSAGAQGIAQFMPAKSRELRVNPWDPVAALQAAANLMGQYNRTYGGDYAKALGAYNAGEGEVNSALQRCGTNWLACVTTDTHSTQTRDYVAAIIGSLP
jgi:hypothetical protein